MEPLKIKWLSRLSAYVVVSGFSWRHLCDSCDIASYKVVQILSIRARKGGSLSIRRLSSMTAVLMISLSSQFWSCIFVVIAIFFITPSQAKQPDLIARIAKEITVRIEGATQGSGVLVKREGSVYTVLTAWHVLSGQRAGEELDLYTTDGLRHPIEQRSIKRLGEVDLAVMRFSSPNSYEVATLGDVKSLSSGRSIYVSGFPLPTSAVPARIFRFLKGDVIANATVAIPNGYQLLYSNPTLPGMSGGAVLNIQGELVGIHGRGETDIELTEQYGVAVKTGTNLAVPISYFIQPIENQKEVFLSRKASKSDDFLAQISALPGGVESAEQIIALSSRSLEIRQSSKGYYLRGLGNYLLGRLELAIKDFKLSVNMDSSDYDTWTRLAQAQTEAQYFQDAIASWSKVIEIKPDDLRAYLARGYSRLEIGDKKGSCEDYLRASSWTAGYFYLERDGFWDTIPWCRRE